MFALTIKKIVTVAAGMVPAARLTAHVDGGLVPVPPMCALDKNGASGERSNRRRSATAIASSGCGAFLSVSGEGGIRTLGRLASTPVFESWKRLKRFFGR